jgi:hypothetical protein
MYYLILHQDTHDDIKDTILEEGKGREEGKAKRSSKEPIPRPFCAAGRPI